MTIWKKTKHPGVRYKESRTRRYKGRPERYYSVRYRRHGKSIEEGLGWETDGGINPNYCARLRGEIVSNIRAGRGHQSLKDRRDEEEAIRQTKQREKQAWKRDKTSFDVLAQHYLDWSRNNKKSWKGDETRYRLHIKPSLGAMPIKEITSWPIERLKQDLKAKGKAPQTVLHCLALVRAMFYKAPLWNLHQGLNPVREATKEHKKFLTIPDASRLEFFSHQQVNILLKELKTRNLKLHDMAFLSLYTGMRIGEIFKLQWADINLEHGIITILDPKNNETARVFLTPQVRNMLQKQRPDRVKSHSFVFTDSQGRKLKEISNTFDRTIQKLKFNEGVVDRRKKLVFHSLRHTFASWLALQGTSIFEIKDLMRHKRIEMTMRYAHLLPDHKRQAVLKLARNQGREVVKFEKKGGRK